MRYGNNLFFTLVAFLLLLTASFSSIAAAQEATPSSSTHRTASYDYEEKAMLDPYLKPTYKRLSQLYWALAMFELTDVEAIDGYLYINECALYQRYLDKDFDLGNLRQAARDSITKNLAFFPTKFEILMPIGLDRYNPGTERFLLDPKSFYLATKRLDVAQISPLDHVCETGLAVPKYPYHFIVVFNIPLSLKEFPLDPEVAEMYLSMVEQENAKGVKSKYHPYVDFSPRFKRIAFLRLKVTMTQFQGMGLNHDGESVPIMFASLEGYDIYADPEKLLPLYSYSYETEKEIKGIGKGRIAIPDGPLIQPTPETEEEEENESGSVLPTARTLD